MTPGRTVGFVTHPSSLAHEMPAGHPERTERLTAIATHLREQGLIDRLEAHTPEQASRTTVELAHDSRLIDHLHELDAAGGGRIDADTSMGTHSLEAALRASQGAVDAVERVIDGRWTSALCCFRPPGHHAERSRAMGFCLTNHIAIAARSAISSGAIDRAVILDWDAHHGNGTQDIFWTDASVLYVSLHQYPWYPGTGDATERGGRDGAGTTINVPLPAGAAEDAYVRALDDVIEPAVADFDPQLVLVSAGYDAHHADPLCMMRLTAGAFDRMTRRASAWGPGPVCVLEGGYDLDALAWSTGATVAAMLGEDPQAGGVPASEQGVLPGEPEAMRWVERAAALARST